jgi:putative transposase
MLVLHRQPAGAEANAPYRSYRLASRVGRRHPFEIDAFVVLPDHMHAIWTLPPGDADFSTRWRLIKTAFAKSLPKQERLSAVRKARNERGIWQRRFWST